MASIDTELSASVVGAAQGPGWTLYSRRGAPAEKEGTACMPSWHTSSKYLDGPFRKWNDNTGQIYLPRILENMRSQSDPSRI